MKEIRKPDLNAPRYRKVMNQTLHREFYDALRANVPSAKNLSNEEIKTIIFSFNGKIWETAISHRDGVELPEQIGHVFIGTCPPSKRSRKRNIDFYKSISVKHAVRHQNWESDEFIAKIFYTNYETKYTFKNRELWSFTATRNFKRTLSSVYPDNWKKYIQVDHTTQISELFKKNIRRAHRMDNLSAALENYNEFDI